MGTSRGSWPHPSSVRSNLSQYQQSHTSLYNGPHANLPAAESGPDAKPQGPHRTQEEIIAQCEARYAEMEAEAARRKADPKLLYPCETCRFYSELGDDGFNWRGMHPQYHTCTQPLVMGLREHGVTLGKNRDRISLCGPEKALWEPKPSRWQRFIEWLERRSP